MKKNRLFGNISSLLVLQGANYILPFIAVPYLVRVLGPEKFGLMAFAQAFIAFFIVFVDYGFNLSATQSIAVHRDNPRRVMEIFSAVMIIKCFFMLAGFLIMAGIVYIVPTFRTYWMLYWVSYLAVVGSVFFPTWLFQGMERMRDIATFTITVRALLIVGIFLYVNDANDYVIAAALQSATLVLAGILSWPVVLKLLADHPRMPSRALLVAELRSGWHVFVSISATNLYTASNTIILGLIAGNTAVGYFSAAEKIIKAMHGLWQPISQAIYPHISTMAAQSRTHALVFIQKSLYWLGAITFISSLSLFIFAEPIVTLVLGSQFYASISLVRWMAFLPVIIVFSNVLGIQTMLTFGFKKAFSRVLVYCGLFNIVIIWPLVYMEGARGAAIAVLLTEILVTLLMGIFLARRGIWPWFGKERSV